MGLFKSKENELLQVLKLVENLMTRCDRLEKRAVNTENRVENLLERMKREEDHCLARRMDNIEKVQNAQGATLEGYLGRFGRLWDEICRINREKLSRPKGLETLDLGSWIRGVDNFIRGNSHKIAEPEAEAALFSEAEGNIPEIHLPFNGEGEWISFAEAKRRAGITSHLSVKQFCEMYDTIFRHKGPRRLQIFYNSAMLTMERKIQPKRRKESTPREKHEGMKQMQTWARIYNKTQEQFTGAMKLLGIERRQGNKKHIQYCFLTLEEAKKINDTIEQIIKA